MGGSLRVPRAAVDAVLCGGEPVRAAVILGSGQSGVALGEPDRNVAYASIPGAPIASAVAGHAGDVGIGSFAGKRVAIFRGRFHLHQGLTAAEAAFPALLAAALGAEALIVTNAAGTLADALPPGTLAVIADHINLLGDDPLRGWSGGERGDPFVGMRGAYDLDLLTVAQEVAAGLGFELPEAVYAAVQGPSYETPAEAAALRVLGADLVGMSTVPEVIAARALGLRVLGISLVTNVAGGPSLAHAEVVAAGRRSEERLRALIAGILERL